VLFWIARVEKQALDDAEGLGRGYDEAVVDVVTADGTLKALAYVASAGATDPARRPYHWYKRIVLAGAIEHGLPAATIAASAQCLLGTIRCLVAAPSWKRKKR
jgi:hypothetical protein